MRGISGSQDSCRTSTSGTFLGSVLCHVNTNNIAKESSQVISSTSFESKKISSLLRSRSFDSLFYNLCTFFKNLSEADPSVRDSSSEALGAIYKALGEKIFMPQVGEVEQIKMDKIKEYAEKTVLLNLRGEPRAGAAASAPAAAPAPAKTAAPAPAASSAAAKKPTIVKPSEAGAKPSSSDAAKKDAAGPKKVVKGGGAGAADAKKKDANAIPDEPDLSVSI